MTDDLAQKLMIHFGESTGLSGTAPPRRYLWTDAFAVCNFLGLYRQTSQELYLNFARELVHQVHFVLGHHRDDDPRSGWISGLPDAEGQRHPTRGGLRIGKRLNERQPDQPTDPQLEWDQDGQYFHYLTKWIRALLGMYRQTEEVHYLHWAVELAVTAHRSFTYEVSPTGPKRMVWKMSIDLRRALVASMGQHDPLDGLTSCLELQAAEGCTAQDDSELADAIADLTQMCVPGHWATEDTLGIGGLLDDAVRLTQLVFHRGAPFRPLLSRLWLESELSLRSLAGFDPIRNSADRRLAFRELGLAIGLHGLERMGALAAGDPQFGKLVQRLSRHYSLAQQIDAFWIDPVHRRSQTWLEHEDINTVMLATSLAPEGYLSEDS